MDWISELFFGSGAAWGGGVPHSVFILALVIATGVLLGKVKIGGISLGVTWILFVGIAFSHFGMRLNEHLVHFVKEFGLILFVFSIGMQVGPGFFSSFRKGGVKLNMLAASIVLLGVLATYIIHLATGIPITTMVGVLSGAVTNTPGLGAAQQTYFDMTGIHDPTIAAGYAVAYPLGVLGIIFTMILLKRMFKVRFEKEEQDIIDARGKQNDTTPRRISLRVDNHTLIGKTLDEVQALINRDFVISRILHKGGEAQAATPDNVLCEGDEILVVARTQDVGPITALIGEEVDMDWEQANKELISRRILITKPKLQGKSLAQLKLRSGFGINITRVNRAGVDLIAHPLLQLQVGDRVTVVGTAQAVHDVEKILGNSMTRLNVPNLLPIFIGVTLGVVLGSIPFAFPGIPQPVKLGLAGGPLIIAILLSRFGPKYKLVTYTTMSANLMLREVGISLFLAAVGLGAGETFVDTVVNGGYIWVAYGAAITVLPLLIVGVIARKVYKLNYFMLIGLLAGSTTDPPALAYANDTAGNEMPAVGYATVYPLTMFLRVLTAQLLILFLT